ncbi:hypothetical protein [Denitromonas iodatirespirans]|uniref:Uncharacterized protein n=1 Tax=Denitromonas iodatirespirans TaxID=2795389 RepID=A0A944D6D4_DENI1|nr:hypothetical protein [Denitromonas iodatirespirans]MBT0960680.1 hypothetical protein [Denitromonas iodatirespirans]
MRIPVQNDCAGSQTRHLRWSTRCGLLILLATCSNTAFAHVKWFWENADCSAPALSPLKVISSPAFIILGVLSFLVMFVVGVIDTRVSRVGSPLNTFAERIDVFATPWMPRLLRYGLAAFFFTVVPYFGDSPVYLTPELYASGMWVPILQLLIAFTLIWRPSAWLGAAGITVLYGFSVLQHGAFHMLDYPIFLGAAAFVAIDSCYRGQRNDLAFAVLRVSAGITLMWAAGEKWLFPSWSAEVMNDELRGLRGNLSPELFLSAAGWIEFCAAYALVFGRRSVQIAAWLLLVPFIAAIPVFGSLDAIGHAPIIIVLLMLGLTRSRLPDAIQGATNISMALQRAITCTLAALTTTGAYWWLHALAHLQIRAIDPGPAAVALLLSILLPLWWLPRSRLFRSTIINPPDHHGPASVSLG